MSNSNGRAIIELQDVTKVYHLGQVEVRALQGVNLQIREGEMVAIVGPSGSGKSSVMNSLGCLDQPTAGTYTLDGQKVGDLNDNQLAEIRRGRVGFVFQTFSLLESLSSRENVEVALNFAGVTGKPARERATRLLVDLGMEDRLHFKPWALSGGEKQRVSIARALANDPLLILADEPTANLDSKHGHDVVVLLRDIARKQGRTVIIVSHDQRIREVADRVLWLEDGRFMEIGR